MRLSYTLIGFFLILVSACSPSYSTRPARVENVNIIKSTDSISANPAVINLDSYGLSSLCQFNNCVYAYNYKEHSIDIIDLDTKTIKDAIRLSIDGPNAVLHEIHGLKAISPDTIVTYDLNNICIMDNSGKVYERIDMPKDVLTRIDCNSRSNISDFLIDIPGHTVMLPITNRDGMDRHSVVVYDYSNNSIIQSYKLNEPQRKGDYGFMRYPNVSYNGELVIYNYPFESEIYILDSRDNTTRRVSIDSQLCRDKVVEYNGHSIEELGWYGAENYFYSPVYYLTDKNLYARIALGKTSLGRGGNLGKAYYDRPFYLLTYDEDFNLTGEFELDRHKYSPYAGWYTLPDGIALYQDNMFQDRRDDNIVIDKYIIN